MKKKSLVMLVLILCLITCWAGAQQVSFDKHLAEYREYLQSLWFLTDQADKISDQQSDAYLEMYSQGHFFKDQLAAITKLIKKEIKADPEASLKLIKARLAKDPHGREYATFRKLLGYNVRVLKAKNPQLNVREILPPKPGATSITGSAELFLSVDEAALRNIPAPSAVSPWALKIFERTFAPTPEPAIEGFAAYQGQTEGRQDADSQKTGWVSAQYSVREVNEVVIKASEMNLRSGPSTDSSAIGKVRAGQRFPFLVESNGWFQISLPADQQSKGAYSKITLVKGTTPFLVQMDSFLGPKEVILTFDDGPTTRDGRTAAVTSAIQASSMPAIFFMLGSTMQQASLQPLVKAVASAGGFPAVHGYYHATSDGKPFTAIPWETIRKHLVDTKSVIKSLTGNDAVFFRPPYGIIRADDLRRIENELSLIPVGWTIDSLDWSIKSSDELYLKITSLIKQRGKGILLMHDIHQQSREVVPRLVNWLKENGYKVVGPERLIDGFRAGR